MISDDFVASFSLIFLSFFSVGLKSQVFPVSPCITINVFLSSKFVSIKSINFSAHLYNLDLNTVVLYNCIHYLSSMENEELEDE